MRTACAVSRQLGHLSDLRGRIGKETIKSLWKVIEPG